MEGAIASTAHAARIPEASVQRQFLWDRRAGWIDVVITAGIIDAVLLNTVFGSITPLIVFGCLGAYFVLRYENITPLLRSSWPLLCLPGLALVSTLWSSLPGTTAYYSVLFLITVFAGLIMGAGLARDSFLKGLTLAFAIYTVLTFLSFRWVPWEGGRMAFAGLAGSKNSAGDVAGAGLLASLAYLGYALSLRKPISALLLAPLFPINLFILYFSHASGALIATSCITVVLLSLAFSRRLPLQARTAIVILLLMTITAMLLTYQLWLPALFDAVLSGSGKTQDLTGRAELWYFADHNLIPQHPWLGRGYKTFWVHNNLDAEYLWRMMGISSRMGFNFHNTPREIIVHLGYLGFAFYILVAAPIALILIYRSILVPSYEHILALSYVLFFTMKMPFEVAGFDSFHFATLLLYASLAAGLRPPEIRTAT